MLSISCHHDSWPFHKPISALFVADWVTLLCTCLSLEDCCWDWCWWHTQIRYSTGESKWEFGTVEELWTCVLDVFIAKILDRIDLLLAEVWWALSAYLITLDPAMDIGKAHQLSNPHNKSSLIHPLFMFADTDTVNSPTVAMSKSAFKAKLYYL